MEATIHASHGTIQFKKKENYEFSCVLKKITNKILKNRLWINEKTHMYV